MGSIRTIEMKLVDQLFQQPGNPGYVLDFSNSTFASFFAQELGVNIYDGRFSGRGTSKMNRLRCYLEVVEDTQAAHALHTLWEYRETLPDSFRENVLHGEKRLNDLIGRLGGKPISATRNEPVQAPSPASVDAAMVLQLRNDLVALSSLEPHARGLAFERFLKGLFNAYGLQGHGSIALRGEQIDGSFRLHEQTYLMEAKWQNEKTGAADLHIFEGKLSQKAVWTRGLFVSQSGFTEDGLHAFGRGKRVICMDGLDLWDALNGQLALPEIIDRKVVRASQTGEIFVRVRDLA